MFWHKSLLANSDGVRTRTGSSPRKLRRVYNFRVKLKDSDFKLALAVESQLDAELGPSAGPAGSPSPSPEPDSEPPSQRGPGVVLAHLHSPPSGSNGKDPCGARLPRTGEQYRRNEAPDLYSIVCGTFVSGSSGSSRFSCLGIFRDAARTTRGPAGVVRGRSHGIHARRSKAA